MNEMELRSTVRPKRYKAYRGPVGKIAPNVLQREFRADRPDQKWLTDITEFKVAGKRLYLSPILDVCTREIVSYSIRTAPEYRLVDIMLRRALPRARHGLLLHSDQGWHYQHRSWKSALESHGIRQSMSRKGNCLDNAQMESFFATLKSECFHGKHFHDVQELEKELHSYIHYYNHERIHCKLKGLSPVEYRTQSFSAADLTVQL